MRAWLARNKLPLAKGQAATNNLPNQRVMSVTLTDVLKRNPHVALMTDDI